MSIFHYTLRGRARGLFTFRAFYFMIWADIQEQADLFSRATLGAAAAGRTLARGAISRPRALCAFPRPKDAGGRRS